MAVLNAKLIKNSKWMTAHTIAYSVVIFLSNLQQCSLTIATLCLIKVYYEYFYL